MNSKTKGQLFSVAIPIGNPLDWTLRAMDVLKNCDIIACEDTRRAALILSQSNIKHKKLISYYDQTEKTKAPQIIEMIKAGESVALISDSGTPLIQDPGFHLLNLARMENIDVIPVPGVSSLTCALQVAPLPGGRFLFAGFLSSKPNERLKEMQDLKQLRQNLVFFEAPHRIVEFLNDALSVFGPIPCTLAREMTKPHEEIQRSNLDSILELTKSKTPLGEFVVVLEAVEQKLELQESELISMIRALGKKGKKAKDILKEIQGLTKMSRKELYNLILNEKD